MNVNIQANCCQTIAKKMQRAHNPGPTRIPWACYKWLIKTHLLSLWKYYALPLMLIPKTRHQGEVDKLYMLTIKNLLKISPHASNHVVLKLLHIGNLKWLTVTTLITIVHQTPDPIRQWIIDKLYKLCPTPTTIDTTIDTITITKPTYMPNTLDTLACHIYQTTEHLAGISYINTLIIHGSILTTVHYKYIGLNWDNPVHALVNSIEPNIDLLKQQPKIIIHIPKGIWQHRIHTNRNLIDLRTLTPLQDKIIFTDPLIPPQIKQHHVAYSRIPLATHLILPSPQ